MLNQVTMVGRLIDEPKIIIKEGKEVCYITLAVPRVYKNENGEYDIDYIDCTIWQGLLEKIKEYCHKGDMVGLQGRIRTTQEKGKSKITEIVAEKVTFLNSSDKKEE